MNGAFEKDEDDHVLADLTGPANHLGVRTEADIVRQKLPGNGGGCDGACDVLASRENRCGKTAERVRALLTTDHPIA